MLTFAQIETMRIEFLIDFWRKLDQKNTILTLVFTFRDPSTSKLPFTPKIVR